jgi:hypothetical protein
MLKYEEDFLDLPLSCIGSSLRYLLTLQHARFHSRAWPESTYLSYKCSLNVTHTYEIEPSLRSAVVRPLKKLSPCEVVHSVTVRSMVTVFAKSDNRSFHQRYVIDKNVITPFKSCTEHRVPLISALRTSVSKCKTAFMATRVGQPIKTGWSHSNTSALKWS